MRSRIYLHTLSSSPDQVLANVTGGLVVASPALSLQLQLRRVARQMPGSMPGTGPRSGVFLDSGFSEVSGRLASPAFSCFLLGLCDELV